MNHMKAAIAAYETYTAELEKYQDLDIGQICEYFREFTKAPQIPVTAEAINNPELKDQNAVLILDFYTPEYNDGAPCVHRLNDIFAATFGELQTFLAEYPDESSPKSEAELHEGIKEHAEDLLGIAFLPCGDNSREILSQVRKAIVSCERVYEDLFGTNVRLIIYANSFDTVYYGGE